MFTLEAGINHFGDLKEARKIEKFFLKSSFKNLSFMLHTQNFYNLYKSKGIDFILPTTFYSRLIKKSHIRKKKIGLSVCDIQSFKKLKDLKFDFYKLLSVSINNEELIKELIKKKKPVFISTGFTVSDINIKKCLKSFKGFKKITILHTPMTYDVSQLNFSRISKLKEKFKLPVGYSNHNNNFETLNLLTSYEPSSIFVYCKPTRKDKRVYPDNKHAIYLDNLEKMKKSYIELNTVHKSLINKKKKGDIFKNGIKK